MNEEGVPPGQRVTDGLPVFSVETPMSFDPDTWRLKVFGTVDNRLELSWDEFLSLPKARVVADFHCVTGWSHLDNSWGGVLGSTIFELARGRPETKYVMMYSHSGYSSNTSLENFLRPDTILAYEWNGLPLETHHGYPLRAVVSSVYGYKSVKWLTGIEFSSVDKQGFWESRGYHHSADPWREERFDE